MGRRDRPSVAAPPSGPANAAPPPVPATPCVHPKWEDVRTLRVTETWDDGTKHFVGLIYVQRCQGCRVIRHERVLASADDQALVQREVREG